MTADTVLDPASLGDRVLVVAPHPDDESIGCGGLIAVLRRLGVTVHVVFVTDGAGSHPSSRDYPSARLAALRRQEALAALDVLAVDGEAVTFLGLQDRFVPVEGAPGYAEAVGGARACLDRLRPTTLVIPDPADSHGDHRAVARIWRAAALGAAEPPRLLDYLVWAGAEMSTDPRLRLDIGPVRDLKRRAVAAHRSQHGLVIQDDPGGFVLPAALLAQANRPYEIYGAVSP